MFSPSRLEATIAEVKAEVRGLRAEFQRLRAIEYGTAAERDPVGHPWLHCNRTAARDLKSNA